MEGVTFLYNKLPYNLFGLEELTNWGLPQLHCLGACAFGNIGQIEQGVIGLYKKTPYNIFE